MKDLELEEKIYEFGNIMYRIGRMETDDKSSTKDYNKFCKQKEELIEQFDNYFKNSKLNQKAAKTLGLIH